MSTSSSKNNTLSPLMRQYHAIKSKYPDKILFFRMGDFYEMFGDDAVKAAPILQIALTSRGHQNGERIPLAGVPYHSADKYLARLLSAGEKVVVVEQTEDPRQAKGIVKRDVVEILTPGTATIDGALEEGTNLYLACLYISGKNAGLAVIDLSTGKFFIDEAAVDEITEYVRLLTPQEILYSYHDDDKEPPREIKNLGHDILTPFESWNFDYKTAVRELSDFFKVSTLDGFGVGGKKLGLTAAGAIYRYLLENNRTRLDHVTRISIAESNDYMLLDYNSVRNLELIKNLSDSTDENSLFSSINRTVTAGGARRLKENILRPYKTMCPIKYRQSGIKELFKDRNTGIDLVPILKKLPDMERLAGRLGMHRINPRQLASIKDGIIAGNDILGVVSNLHAEIFKSMVSTYPDLNGVADKIGQALVNEPPLSSNKGDIIRPGYSDELDGLVNSIRDARDYIASLQNTEREKTGIPSLKVGYNKVFGYYIEVTRTHSDKIPDSYIRKQTLVNAERYITQELKEKEELIQAAEEKIFTLEERLFSDLVEETADTLPDILLAAGYLSEIDLVVSLANLAAEKHYCCPEIDETCELEISGGRHPVIEDLLPPGSFIANDITLSSQDKQIMILTGPVLI